MGTSAQRTAAFSAFLRAQLPPRRVQPAVTHASCWDTGRQPAQQALRSGCPQCPADTAAASRGAHDLLSCPRLFRLQIGLCIAILVIVNQVSTF